MIPTHLTQTKDSKVIKVTKVEINKYKCIQKRQTITIDPKITTIVGMNESGKTSFLTALAKTNYFNSDNDFKFDLIQDYPRSDLINFQSEEEDCKIIEIHYHIEPAYVAKITQELGEGVFSSTDFTYSCYYKNTPNCISGITANQKKFLELLVKRYNLSEATKKAIINCGAIDEIPTFPPNEFDVDLPVFQAEIKRILDNSFDNWPNRLEGYIAKSLIKPKMPKFWYFDDYYPLRGKININKLHNESPKDERDKTSKALFELARIKTDEILSASDKDYEKFIAILEASSNKITGEVFKYWSTNKNLDIEFKIQSTANAQGQQEKVLDIRVKSQRHRITLPLDRRSKGFNWFFSFIIWFSKIQADKNSDYVLLLDEPGLNLHASAQADLLRFIEDLSKKYQIIYTTHSPFMVESNHLERVRTCYESDEGTIISDSIQEKDPNTLFPLQAALGYDIAQNLFISKNNLLVEGPADLIYLTILSSILESENRTFLNPTITIVPVGGLDKVSSFISLLRGSKLNIACLLDTYTDQKGKQRVDDLIKQKIIKEKSIRFFDEFISGTKVADIEDLFEVEEYLLIFNAAFNGEYRTLTQAELDPLPGTIIKKINKALDIERFNHYRPANKLNQIGVTKANFNEKTLHRFEKIFKEINKLFD